jgi:hypothetical protein
LVNFVLELSELISPPSFLGEPKNLGLQWFDIVRAEIFDGYVDIHGLGH